MKKLAEPFILLLLLAIQHDLQAQNINIKKPQAEIKKNTTKDLNRLETDKIKAISVNRNPSKDTLLQSIKSDSIAYVKLLSMPVKKEDSIIRKVIPVDVAEEVTMHRIDSIIQSVNTDSSLKNARQTSIPETLVRNEIIQKASADDSFFYSKYDKNAKFADSIRNANKHWLDSTLSTLPKKKQVIIHEDDEIEIFVSGGGFYAGVNPKIYDRLTIYNSGLIHREFKTKLQGEIIEEKKLSKEALKKLAQFIIDMGFFDFNNLYDCNPKDIDCKTRMKSKPEAVPLSVSVVVGVRRNKTYVTFFAPKIESNYVNYPTSLEKIVEAIYAAASQ